MRLLLRMRPNCPSPTMRRWAILSKHFPALRQIRSVGDINTLRNGITLRDSVYAQSGQFTVALQATDIEDEDGIKTYKRYPPADIAAIRFDRRVWLMPKTEYKISNPGLLDAH